MTESPVGACGLSSFVASTQTCSKCANSELELGEGKAGAITYGKTLGRMLGEKFL